MNREPATPAVVIDAARALVAAIKVADEDDDWADDPYLTLVRNLVAAVDQLDETPAAAEPAAAVPPRCRAAWETANGCYPGNRIHDCALIGGHRTHRCSCGASTEDTEVPA